MKTMKLFIKLLIAFVLLYFFVDFMSFAYVASTYKKLDRYTVTDDQVEITVLESQASKVSGYVDAIVTNKTSQDIASIYIGIDCFSEYDNPLDTVYTKIEGLKQGESRQIKLSYQCEKVNAIKIYDSKEVPQGKKMERTAMDRVTSMALIVGALIVLYFC